MPDSKLSRARSDLLLKLQDRLVEAEIRIKKRNLELEIKEATIIALKRENEDLKKRIAA